MPDKYDDVLLPFLTLMRKELHANSRKGDRPGWLRMDPNTALLEVYWHTAKLSAAVKNNDGPAIMEHAADVANMAMMVLDVCGGLAFVDGVAPSADAERLDWLQGFADVRLEAWFADGDVTRRVTRNGRTIGSGRNLREAIDAARAACPRGPADADGVRVGAPSVPPSEPP